MNNEMEFGQMKAEVHQLKQEMKELREDVKGLLELANKTQGGFWASMTAASALGAFVSWILTHWPFK